MFNKIERSNKIERLNRIERFNCIERQRISPLKNKNGFTIIEILLVILLLGIAITPMMESLSPTMKGSVIEMETTQYYNAARATLSRLTELSYLKLEKHKGSPADLTALFDNVNAVQEETITFQGKDIIPVVSITDVSAGQGGLLEIRVGVDRVNLKTLIAEY